MANINNTANDTLLSGTSGNDSIENKRHWGVSTENVTIDAGAGNDSISNHFGANISINAGADNDYIYNMEGSSVTIDAGAGNDTIANGGYDIIWNWHDGGSNVSINAGAGNDYISNWGSNVSISAGAGNDSIQNNGSNVLFNYSSDDGNDTISGFNSTSTLSITGGSYSTQVSGNDLIVMVGNGKITLLNASLTANSIHINDETITLEPFVKLSDSGETIYPTRDSISILGGAGDDSIYNRGDSVTIDSGAGNDTISNDESSNSSINAGDGNDYIYNSGNNVTIDSGAGYDSIYNDSGDSALINGGAVNDTIRNNGGDRATINAGADNDLIALNDSAEFNVILYTEGDGNDTIRGFNSDDTLKISGSSYSTLIKGDNVIVTVGTGKITLQGAASLSAVNIDFEKTEWKLNGTTATYGSLTVKGVTSLDGIKLNGTTVTISAAALDKKKVTVSDGYKLKLGSDVTKTSTKKSWTLDGTTATYKQTTNAGYSLVDNEIIYSKAATENLITVSGVKSLDGLKVKGTTVTVTKSSLGTKDVTLSGDGYTLALGSTVPAPTTAKATYASGKYKTAGVSKAGYSLDGNTIRYVAKDIKTIKFSGADDDATVKNFYLSGNVMTIGKAAVKTDGTAFKLLTDGYSLKLGKGMTASATDDAWTLSKTTARLKRTTTAGYSLDDNAITYIKKSSKTLATVKGVTSLDGLSLSGKILTVSKSALGTNDVTISDGYALALGDDVNASTTKKSWTLKNSTATYKQTTTAGYSLDDSEIIYSKKSSSVLATVTGVTSFDGLSLSGKILTVNAASLGTSKVTVSDGYTLALGDDVDASTTKKSWTLKNSTATYKQTTAAGYSLVDNEIIYSKKSSKTLATVTGVNDKSGLKVSGSTIKLSGDALSQKVTVSGDYTFDFDSDFKNATISGSSSDDTIIARGKNIFVTGGDGADVFALKSTGTIGDYESEDKISLTGAADISTDGNDLIFNKKITVAGAADKVVTYIEGGVEKIFEPEENDAVQYNAAGTAVTLTANYSEDFFVANDTLVTIDASTVNQEINIVANKKANSIVGSEEDDTIDGGAAKDTIRAGDGSDQIFGGKGNDKLFGGAGSDSLWGGLGEDTLTGGKGYDVFIYSDGDGRDLITDYEPDVDRIMILSGKVENPTTDTDGNVTFRVGDGQIVIADGASKYIELYDSSGNNLTQKYIPR